MKSPRGDIWLDSAIVVLLALFVIPNWLPLLMLNRASLHGVVDALSIVDWSASIIHALTVALIGGLCGSWFGISAFHAKRAPWKLLGIWLALAALIPAPLLAQSLALITSATQGTGRNFLLLIGHGLIILPITFVLTFRIVSASGEGHFLVLTNLGSSKAKALLSLLQHRFRGAVLLGVALSFFIILNESAMSGSLGGSTAYFGSVMHNLALGSASPYAVYVGGFAQMVSLLAVLWLSSYDVFGHER